MRIRRAGRTALLVELADLAEAQAWYAEVLRRREAGELPGIREVVPGARTVLLDGVTDTDHAAGLLAGWPAPSATTRVPATGVTVPVRYDGPDLAAVADHWRMPVDEVVRIHTSTEFTVAFCGFSPGFAYLAGLPQDRQVPRLDTPRTRVPAGAIGLAGPWCGVYPSDSPGGWRLIGRTSRTLFDLNRDPPALLVPGMTVRFDEADTAGPAG